MKNKKLMSIVIIILPIIDLITSIGCHYFPNTLSVGKVVKVLYMFIAVYYILFKSTSKYRRFSCFSILLFTIYFISYFIFKSDLLGDLFIIEFGYLLKLFYFPIMFLFLLNYFDDYGFDKDGLNKLFLINLITYIILIVIPTIFDLNFDSYINPEYTGSVGWFYSANEVSTILLLLFPFMYFLINKHNMLLSIIFVLSIYMVSLIGTKVTLFGIIIVTFTIAFFTIVKNKSIKKKSSIFTLILFIVTFIFMVNNYSTMNLRNAIDNKEQEVLNELENNLREDATLGIEDISSMMLSSRDLYAINTYKIYKNSFRPDYVLYGMGFSNTDRINDKYIAKMIEIDFLDILYHMGIIGFIIFLLPFLLVLKMVIKLLINHKFNINVNICFWSLMIMMTLGISSVAGHVYLAPAVSIYVCFYLIYLIDSLNILNKKEINNKKIAILSMHLGYGGVENVVTKVANYLSDNYEVEIVSLYKNSNEPYKINKNVKVTYLMNTISNREEFKKEFKCHHFYKVLKEGIKALKIILTKDLLIKNYLINSDAKIIISTRYKFSMLLDNYGRNETIKIHQEHTYNVTNNYIKNLNRLKNIDYIVPVSKALKQAYNKKVYTKLKYIPLSLENYPEKLSKLNNKKLVAVGRIEDVKGFDDLVLVMQELVSYNKDYKLEIIGEGSKRKELTDMVNKLNLCDNVCFTGYQTEKYINDVLNNSSLYVMTSHEESFGLSVLEAMSNGLPCIQFSSAKGCLEMVNKDNGYIIKDRDIKKMAKTIDSYFKLNGYSKKKMGLNARKISEKYNEEEIKKDWLKFIGEII